MQYIYSYVTILPCTVQISAIDLYMDPYLPYFHKNQEYGKVCTQWVSKQLTDLHKQEVVTHFLRRYEDQHILERIVTDNETLVHHYVPDIKRPSTEWTHPFSPPKKKLKCQPSPRKSC